MLHVHLDGLMQMTKRRGHNNRRISRDSNEHLPDMSLESYRYKSLDRKSVISL
jgi:hypothetical protein